MGTQAHAQAPGADTKDTLDNRVVPIVLVPGVMGTRLKIPGATADWDPDSTLAMGQWVAASRRRNVSDIDFRRAATPLTDVGSTFTSRPRLRQIALDHTNPRPPPRSEQPAVVKFYEGRGWGEVVESFYKDILIGLEETLNPGGDELRPVYAVGYDWRQSNQDSAKRLSARVQEFIGRHPLAQQAIIVTHSMGGLVTRAALQQGLGSRVLGVIHTVMPADGAVVAYRRFLTGGRSDFGDAPSGLNRIIGATHIEYSLMQSVLRGPTELLPADSYPDTFVRMTGDLTNKFFPDVFGAYEQTTPPGILYKQGDVVTDGLFSSKDTVTATDVDNLRSRFREAKVFTRSIAGVVHPRTFLLFGTNQPNDVEFDFTKGTPTADGSKMNAMVIRKPDGDGTVPAASSRFDAATNVLGRKAFGVTHAECFQFAEFRAAVIARVRQLLLPP
ncbi:MAG TPA: hypothetical protein VMI54_01500 [Polyangiaceae bacterium]|nr:hypothetical protein [Polyangiaceae bacterium]